jgi:hypothetical protein
MMNKKLIALFVAVATVSAVSAGWYDEDGNYHHGVRSHHVVGDTTRGAGHAAERTVEGAEDVTFGTVGGLFGGRGVHERMEDREARREQRRMDRQERRNKYNRE